MGGAVRFNPCATPVSPIRDAPVVRILLRSTRDPSGGTARASAAAHLAADKAREQVVAVRFAPANLLFSSSLESARRCKSAPTIAGTTRSIVSPLESVITWMPSPYRPADGLSRRRRAETRPACGGVGRYPSGSPEMARLHRLGAWTRYRALRPQPR